MPFTVLSGATAQVSIDVAPFTLTAVATNGVASGTIASSVGSSLKCHFGSLNLSSRRNVADEITTFCSSAYTLPIPGRISIDVSLGGYVTSGSTYSNPFSLIDPGTSPYMYMTAAFDTGCSFSAPFFTTLDDLTINAFGSAPRNLQGRVVGKPSSAWVVS